MSPLLRSGGFSTSAAGLSLSPQTFRARWKMPCIIASSFTRVAAARSTVAIQKAL
jgi:hypothetical protein